MAIAFDSSTYGQSGAATSFSFSHTCTGSDRILWVYVMVNTTGTVSVTYNGVPMDPSDVNSGSFNHYQSMWYLVAPDTGANDVTVSVTSSSTMRAYAASYTGASQTGQPDAHVVPSEETTTSYAKAITTVADNSWVVWGLGAMSGATLTAGSNTVVRHQPEVTAFGAAFCDSGTAFTPAGSQTLTVTSSSQTFCSIMASFAPAGGGGGATYRRKALLGVGQ